jgi:hypothetical protein
VPADVEVSVQAVPIPSERHLASAID